MTIRKVTDQWSDPITLSERMILQVQSQEPVLIAFGAALPNSLEDGLYWAVGKPLVLESGQTIRIRASGLVPAATVYMGTFK